MMATMPLRSTIQRLRLLIAVVFVTLIAAGSLCLPAYAAKFNVKDYGAQGNGISDDSQAIASAIQAATGKGSGNVVYFPSGTYLIGDLAPKLQVGSVTLEGQHENSTALDFSASTAHMVLAGAAATVRNLTIADTGSGETSGIVGSGVQSYVIDHCIFRGWTGHSVRLTASTGVLENDLFSVEPNSYGIRIDDSTYTRVLGNTFSATGPVVGYGAGLFANDTSSRFLVENNKFNSLLVGVRIHSGSDSYHGSADVISNSFEGCNFGVDSRWLTALDLYSNTFKNGSASSLAIYDFHSDSASFVQNSIDSVYIGIRAESQNTSLTVSNNHMTNIGQRGLWALSVPNMQVVNNSISGKPSTTLQGVLLQDCQIRTGNDQIAIANNTIRAVNVAILSVRCSGTVESFNTIGNIQNSGIYSDRDYNLTVKSNRLTDCGLSPGYGAVIYVSTPSDQGQYYFVYDNSYTGNVKYLSYFVYVKVRDGLNIDVHGNQTNTMLPSSP